MQSIKTRSAAVFQTLIKPSPTTEPPSAGDIRRIDLAVLGVVLFALFLGLGIRNQTVNASTWVSLGRGLPRIAYPATWMPRTGDEYLVRAVNVGSPSLFDPQMAATARPQRADETLELARADRTFQFASSLTGYRELDAEQVMVYRNTPAIMTTYGLIADPTRDSGATGLPVVVQAQDVMFFDNGQFIVVTVAADASQWDAAQADFQTIFASMRLRPMPAEDLTVATPTPAPDADPNAGEAPAAPATDESFSGASQQGAEDAEGGN